MMRRVTPVFAVIFAVLLAAPAFAQRNRDRDQDRDQGPRETENVDRTLALAPGGTVRLKTFSGRVTITGTSGSQVVIKAVRRAHAAIGSTTSSSRSRRAATSSRSTPTIGSSSAATTTWSKRTSTSRCRSQSKLDLRTFSAPITVSGVTGDDG